MDVTALKRRARRFLRVFVILRTGEFLLIITLASAWGFLEENRVFFNTSAYYLNSVVHKLQFSFAVTFVYYITSMYIFFSMVIFVATEILYGLNSRNISFVNALPYAIHGFILLSMARYPTILSIMWILIVIFNFYIPKRLEEKLFGPPES